MKWTTEDVRTLRRRFCTRTTQEVANELGRTTRSVQLKANKLGLKKTAAHMRRIRKRS